MLDSIAHPSHTLVLYHLYLNPSLRRLFLPLKYLDPILQRLDLHLRRLPQHALLKHLDALIDQIAAICGPSLALLAVVILL